MVSTDANGGHYFEGSPTVASNRREIELVLPDVYLSLTTDSGVFAGGAVDKGTKYLLRSLLELPPLDPSPGSVLDLGCGYGPIGLAMAKRLPDAQVWGVDVNERAIGLAKENAKANEVANATFGPAAAIHADQRFDLIVSNPPIRIGKQALHDLLSTWLDRLNPGGRAWMVVQKHLGSDSLAAWLTDQGWETTRLSSKSGFRILETRARPTQDQPGSQETS